MRLICRTTAIDAFYGFAQMELTPELAQRLLTYRPLFEQVRGHDRRLYSLEFFNNEIDYGEDFEGLDGDGIAAGSWWEVADFPALCGDWRTCAETLKITDTGVFWSASPKHSDGSFETELIPWEDLEAVARGERPFDTHKEESEVEA